MITTKFFNDERLQKFSIKDHFLASKNLQDAYNQLVTETGKGNDFVGWLHLPTENCELIDEVKTTATVLAEQSEVVVVIGIGGSYLGTRAVVEALQHQFRPFRQTSAPMLLYAGNNMSEDYLHDLLDVLNEKEYSLIVISKSGTTTEPAIAFRVLKEHCEKKYGKAGAAQRIVAITDAQKGALKQLANEENYKTFVIPSNVGGRYSVLTPVGLLPIAVAGFDIEALLRGAAAMERYLFDNQTLEKNIALQYALTRHLLYKKMDKKIELMVAFEPRLYYFIEWYKQLFGESDGKENGGVFPAGAIFSTDLHSLGQYIQEGERHLFETVLSVESSHYHVPIPTDEADIDGLNYLCMKKLQDINQIAEQGTKLAHLDGDVPCLRISVPEISEQTLGELIYFFEFSCALGGYLLGINPFDQPGVEAYKQNMFRLLGKPKR